MDAIHLVNAADAAYVPHTAAMLHSVFSHAGGATIQVHFLHRAGLDPAALEQLRALCARHGAGFRPVEVPAAALAGLPIRQPFTEEAWYRVVLPGLLPDVQRALWLDSDVIALGSLRELWDLDLGGLPLAACPNAVMFSFRDVIEAIGIADREKYFNSGVMLMDLARMRAEDSETALREAAGRARPWIRFADQDVLNMVYHRRYVRLRLAWNVLSQSYFNIAETLRVHGREEYAEAMAQPRIVHFTGTPRYKPWFHTCAHPHRDRYLHHRAAAGWPPPAFPDKSVWTHLVRRIPFRVREFASTVRRREYAEALSYLRRW